MLNIIFRSNLVEKPLKNKNNIGILALFELPLTAIRVKTTCLINYPVERVTVNHDVAGSSPAGGAKKAFKSLNLKAFFISYTLISPPV